uniref:Uncharacterized protein n=1 Tax=viral metagenome TaxID=1070528 RepID=A0A6C0LMX9_9ZZZZ
MTQSDIDSVIRYDLNSLLQNIPSTGKPFDDKKLNFKELLISFLQKITVFCNKYIENLFTKDINMPDLTCLNYGINKLKELIEKTNNKNNDDIEKFKKLLLELLENIPKPLSQYRVAIRNYKNEYLENENNRLEIKKTVQETQQQLALQPKSFINIMKDFYNKNSITYLLYDVPNKNLEDELTLDFALQILSEYQYICGGNRIVSVSNGETALKKKEEKDYTELDYFILLKNKGIDDDEGTVAKYETFLKSKLALDYLNSKKSELSNYYYSYVSNEISADVRKKDYHLKRYNDSLSFIISYTKQKKENYNENSLKTMIELYNKSKSSQGGNANIKAVNKIKKLSKKTILGKERCIYAIQGDRKEYLRYKGDLIPVKDYKKVMSNK